MLAEAVPAHEPTVVIEPITWHITDVNSQPIEALEKVVLETHVSRLP